MKNLKLYFLCFSVCIYHVAAQPLPQVLPQNAGMSSEHLRFADEVIQKAIDRKEIPGAVLAVVKDGKTAYLKAYGNREVYPNTVEMNVNTVFDLASVTKPIATATSAMILIERGQLRLSDKVNMYIPEFEGWKTPEGKTIDIRVSDIMTHTSGLPSYAPVEVLEKKYGAPNPNELINYIATCKRDFAPQTVMQYSCLNYITLQRIIETISKQSLRDFAKENIFDVLGMKHTDYKPEGEILARTAPTEKQKDGTVLRGEVHDPLARIMNGGVSGNAGLFSDAEDIALYVAALQNGGEVNGKRILSPLGVETMRTVYRSIPQFGRTPGWDVSSPYASNTGDLLGPNTYGHTGYTGTSVVIDPDNNLAIILLTNRVHPDDKGSVTRLRSIVANTVAASVLKRPKDPDYVQAVPAPKWSYEEHYKKRIAQFDTEPPITKEDIVMLGNSITEGGGDWSILSDTRRIRNRGISGDISAGVFNRLEPIVSGKPRKLFLLIGINDISMNIQVDTVMKNIAKIIDKIKAESPATEIYLQSILPVDQSFDRYKGLNGKTPLIVGANLKLKEIAKAKRVTFVNLYPHFTEKNTHILRKELTNDGLHLNKEGYQVWAKIIKKQVNK